MGEAAGADGWSFIVLLLERCDHVSRNLDHALVGLKADYGAIDSVAVGVDAKAVGKHGEFARLGGKGERDQTQNDGELGGRTTKLF